MHPVAFYLIEFYNFMNLQYQLEFCINGYTFIVYSFIRFDIIKIFLKIENFDCIFLIPITQMHPVVFYFDLKKLQY